MWAIHSSHAQLLMQKGSFVRAHVIDHDPGLLPWSVCGSCSSTLIKISPVHLVPQNIAAVLQAVLGYIHLAFSTTHAMPKQYLLGAASRVLL